MKLLSLQKKMGEIKQKSEIDFARIKNRQDIQKILETQREKGKLKWFEYEQETQEKLKELNKLFVLIKKTEEEFEEFAEKLKISAQRKFESIEQKIEGLEKRKAELQEPLLAEQKTIQLFLSKIKEERQEQEKKEGELGEKADWIRRNVTEISSYLDSLKELERELTPKKIELRQFLPEISEGIKKFHREMAGLKEESEKLFEGIKKEKERVKGDNVAIASSKDWFLKVKNQFEKWETDLEKKRKDLASDAEKTIISLIERKNSLEKELLSLIERLERAESSRKEFSDLQEGLLLERIHSEKQLELFKKEKSVFDRYLEQAKESVKDEEEKIESFSKQIKEDLKEIRGTEKEVQTLTNFVLKNEERVKKSAENLEDALIIQYQKIEEKGKKAQAKIKELTKEQIRYIAWENKTNTISGEIKKLFGEILDVQGGVTRAVGNLKNTRGEIVELLKGVNSQFGEIKQKAELNNIQITSAEKLMEKVEERFKNWEKRLVDREETLRTAFQEARQKGIY